MEPKIRYQLVAWTERDEIRIVPGVLYLIEEPYLDRIYDLSVSDLSDLSSVLELSHNHELYGNFLLRCGNKGEAFDQYAEAARICLAAADPFWVQCERHDTLCQPLRYRFYAMFDRCCDFVRNHPKFRQRMIRNGIIGDYRQLSGDLEFRFDAEE